MSTSYEKREALRSRILKEMFDGTVGANRDPDRVSYTPNSISKAWGLDVNEVLSALKHLESKFLIKSWAVMEIPYETSYSITQYGIAEIEDKEKMEAEAINEQKDKQRLAVLKHMYEVAVNQKGNSGRTLFNAKTIADAISLAPSEVDTALTYLGGEGFVTLEARPHDGLTPARISHAGIKEIESVRSKPERGTEHFSPPVTQHFYGAVGTVQTGSHATANVTQNIGADLASTLVLIGQLKQQADKLPEDEQEEARDTLDVLSAELKGDRDPKRVNATLRGLATFGRGTVAFASQVATLANQVKDLLGITPT